MKLLAVDTSRGRCAGVAILTEDGIRHECAVMNHKTHSVNLLPMIDNAFQSTGLTIQDMDRLAVVVGPGSFTGVRLGVSTVKGLAHGAGEALRRGQRAGSNGGGHQRIQRCRLPDSGCARWAGVRRSVLCGRKSPESVDG